MESEEERLKKIKKWKEQRKAEKNKELPLPKEPLLVSGGLDKTLRVWTILNGKEIKKLNCGQVYSLDCHPKRNIVALGTGNRSVEVWELDKGKKIKQFQRHSSFVNSVKWNATGNRIASIAGDASARVWDTKKGEIGVLEGHMDYMLTGLAWLNERKLVTCAMDKTVRIWDLNDEKEVDQFQIKEKTGLLSEKTLTPTSLTWDQSRKRLAVGTREGVIQVLDNDWNVLERINNAHEEAVSSLKFENDGTMLLSGSFDSFTKVWAVKKGDFDLSSGDEPLEKSLAKHGGSVYWVDWGGDGRWVASSGKDASIIIWDTEEWNATMLTGHRDSVLSFAISQGK